MDIQPGVVLVDKPAGMTSFGIVHRIRKLTGIKKVGHAGTLDPFATGLLVVCVGRPATRHIHHFMAGRKEYEAVLQLGIETATMDPEGQVIRTATVPPLEAASLSRGLERFCGVQLQRVPPFSAVKHKGKPLYAYARKGIVIAKEPRRIVIYSLALLNWDQHRNQLGIRVICGPGTYVRVLADDIGRWLGCGAHLVELRRIRSGPFTVTESLAGAQLDGEQGRRLLAAGMMSVDTALQLKETGRETI